MVDMSMPSTPTRSSRSGRSIHTQSFQEQQPPMPSPSRSRLDPQYSARLSQPPLQVNTSCPLQSPPRNKRSTSYGKSPIGQGNNFFFGSSVGGTSFSTPERGVLNRAKNVPVATASPKLSSPVVRNGHFSGNANFSPRASNNYTTSPSHRRSQSQQENIDTGYSDRFIPSRVSSNLSFSLMDAERGSNLGGNRSSNGNATTNDAAGEANRESEDADGGGTSGSSTARGGTTVEGTAQQPILNMLLRSELLDITAELSSPHIGNTTPGTPQREGTNIFRYQSPRQQHHHDMYGNNGGATSVVKAFNLSPVGSASSHRLLASPQKRKRRIAKVPFKVLDAPALQDDFYLNLVDWSSLNVLAVGLGSCVYLWSACTSKVTKLCDLASAEDVVTSVSWTQRGTHLAVGTNRGEVQLWDTIKCKKVRTMGGHSARIGTLSWNGPTLASGSRDRLIYLRDVRIQQPFTARLSSHKQEVCGLKWSFDEPSHLASGGNDNKLLVWDIKNHSQPVNRFAEHTAAVKAIAWSPHQHGLLASGGGTADRCIRFWNTLSGTSLSCIDTGSQVCNLAWSKNCQELVSTHGYSLNQIVVWRYPSMSKVATLTGHTYRVLYLAMSPDGSTIVTGAGDETLRFWQVFPGPRSHDKSTGSGLLFPSSPGSVVR